MAKFLNTRKAVSELADLIRDSGAKLILISPYLQLSKDFRELLEYRSKKNLVTTIIFRELKLQASDLKFLQGLRFVVLKSKDDLHAKCYLSETKMIITSLNLYEYSMANNKEMGVLLDRDDPQDKATFADALKEIEFINETSKEFAFDNTKVKAVEKNATPTGFCIRTGVPIPFNLEKPFSYEAYQAWAEYNNPEYPEKYCHFSGEKSHGETCMFQPVMKKNWNRARETFGF